MPEISRFYGIIIRLYFADHNPPHFHAFYGEDMVEVDIQRGVVLAGQMPNRALGMVLEWSKLHEQELLALFLAAQKGSPLHKVEPLP